MTDWRELERGRLAAHPEIPRVDWICTHRTINPNCEFRSHRTTEAQRQWVRNSAGPKRDKLGRYVA